MTQYPSLPEHLARHKIKRADLEAWGFRFREVVLDRRALKAGWLNEYVLEWNAETALLQNLQELCRETTDVMHFDSLDFFIAERICRSIIDRAVKDALRAQRRAQH